MCHPAEIFQAICNLVKLNCLFSEVSYHLPTVMNAASSFPPQIAHVRLDCYFNSRIGYFKLSTLSCFLMNWFQLVLPEDTEDVLIL